jgi:hypothetical protein
MALVTTSATALRHTPAIHFTGRVNALDAHLFDDEVDDLGSEGSLGVFDCC